MASSNSKRRQSQYGNRLISFRDLSKTFSTLWEKMRFYSATSWQGDEYIIEDNIYINQNDGYSLQYEDNYFDYVFSMLTFQHISSIDILKSYFNETYRVLKINGIFKFQIHKPVRGYSLEPVGIRNGFFGIGLDDLHSKQLLENVGFTNIIIENDHNWLWVTTKK